MSNFNNSPDYVMRAVDMTLDMGRRRPIGDRGENGQKVQVNRAVSADTSVRRAQLG